MIKLTNTNRGCDKHLDDNRSRDGDEIEMTERIEMIQIQMTTKIEIGDTNLDDDKHRDADKTERQEI